MPHIRLTALAGKNTQAEEQTSSAMIPALCAIARQRSALQHQTPGRLVHEVLHYVYHTAILYPPPRSPEEEFMETLDLRAISIRA